MNLLNLVSKSEGLQQVFWENGVYVGDFVVNDDGYWVFFSDHSRKGYWDELMLKALFDKLQEINKPWNDQLNSYCANQR